MAGNSNLAEELSNAKAIITAIVFFIGLGASVAKNFEQHHEVEMTRQQVTAVAKAYYVVPCK